MSVILVQIVIDVHVVFVDTGRAVHCVSVILMQIVIDVDVVFVLV